MGKLIAASRKPAKRGSCKGFTFFRFRSQIEPGNGLLRPPEANPEGRAETVVSKERPIPKPKTVIGNSAKHLTLKYAELLHLRQAVREAELQAGKVSHPPGPNVKQGKTSPAAD